MPRKPALPYPTDAELAILQILWGRGPSSVREIWDALHQKTGYTTVLKTLQIMLGKKLVRRNDREFTHIYEPAFARDAMEQHLVAELIDRAFSGSASQLVLRALAAKPVSPSELEAIRELLAQATKKRS